MAGFIVVMIGTNFYLDLLWFRELQAEGVFWTQYLTQWGLRLAAWLVLFAFLFVNLLFTRRHVLSFPNIQLREQLMASGFMHLFTPRRLTFYFLIFSAVIAFLFSGYVSGHWMEVLRFINGVSFNITDPVFSTDISYFVFNLPFYRLIYGFLMMMLAVTLIGILAIHLFLHYPTSGQGRWMMPSGAAVIHLSVLLSGIFALKAWDYRLQQLELVLSERGVVFGAGFTDIHANLPVLKVLLVLAALIALLFIVNIFLRRPRILVYGVLTMIGVSLLGGWAYPAAIQSFRVEPSEFAMERPYLEHNIKFTRQAYGLDQFTHRHFPASKELSWSDLEENPGTINNVRLWDYRPLLRTFNEQQAIRLYYRFNDVDIDRYTVDGDYRQVMLSARELDKGNLASEAQSWVNMHLQYTHGFGVAMVPVNEVSPRGLPSYFLGALPPSPDEEPVLENPAIYFGELTDDYVIINTNTPEFHYATATGDNEFTTYEGEAGIPLHSMFRRLLLALKFTDYRILISGELSNESRILFDRDIETRVQKIAPFLRYDRDPYIVVSDGRLFWIQDAYTVTDRYPYSTQYGSINYIRNSVKVVVDAYNGTVDFFIVDPGDPLVLTYSEIFPGLFKDMSEMPEGLVSHLRYPEDLFSVQAQVTKLYHITDPNVFYAKEDLWAVAEEKYEGQDQLMEPYYTILQLPGYSGEEFVLILPFTPVNRNIMAAWMVARCDQPNYGKVEIFSFPIKGGGIPGPKQVEFSIDQSTEISELLTLWDQAGSRVIRGNLLVLPINDSLIYVEPVFLEAERGGLPELARVIVYYDETVVMERTLESALVRLFGERGELPPDVTPVEPVDPETPDVTDPPVTPGDETVASLARQAQQVFLQALQRQRQGDWAGYGEKMNELEQILNDLARLVE